jgi:hypothetical protein
VCVYIYIYILCIYVAEVYGNHMHIYLST